MVQKHSKKIRAILVIFVLFCSFLCSDHVVAKTQGKEFSSLFLTRINEYRQKAGISNLTWDDNLYQAAENHTKYMSYHQVFQTQQQKYSKYFSGVYPMDRTAYFGYRYPLVMEFNGKNLRKDAQRIDTFIKNPYERIFWLSPEYKHMVFASTGSYSSFLLGGEKVQKDQIVVYPGHKQKDVLIDDAISLAYYSKNAIQTLEEVQVKMKDILTGRSIEVKVDTPKNNEYLMNGIVITPTSKLQYDRTYQVEAKAKVIFSKGESKVISKSWNFTTIPANNSKMNDTIGHWSEEMVHQFYKKGIVEPKKGTYFYPDALITRQEFAKMIAKAFHLPEPKEKQTFFSDISKNNPYEKYIYMVQEQEWMNGFGSSFYPTRSLTREEGIVIVMRAYEQLQQNKKNTTVTTMRNKKEFSDIRQVSSWARDSIIGAQKINLLQGRNQNKCYPKEKMTRAEAVTLLYRLLELTEAEE